MNFTVLWTPLAERQLAQIWMDAGDRDSVTKAASQLDEVLRADPHAQGESRSGPLRIVFTYPLASYVAIREHDRRVFVLAVWRTS